MNLAPAYDAWLEEVKTEEQITIARRMLQRNVPIEDIASDTGLSIEFLQTLRWSTTDQGASNESSS
jgi:hypothetical protein